MPLLDRLMGTETEYAIRLPRNAKLASHYEAFLAITNSLRRKIPSADADAKQSGKPGIFLATGGAVWMESKRPATNFCFIEGASPECRSPRELLACQRAQDRLLEKCAVENGVTLLKNCCDHRGKTYGAQESYEVKFASGIMLWIWRIAAVMLFLPLCIAVQVPAVLAILAWIVCLPMTALVFVAKAVGKPKREVQRLFDYWIGRVIRTGWDGVELPSSGFFSGIILAILLIAVAPLAFAICLLVECTRLGKLQRQLAPFIATRIIFSGAGPVGDLKRINADPSLRVRCKLKNGEKLTAIEIQRRYFDVCRRYLNGLGEIPEEVQDIMYRWESTLDELQSSPQSLIGRVDWVTKKFLIDNACAAASDASRKKMDLRYHELSDEGYFRRFETTGLHHRVLEEEDVVRATRLPPMNTPAHARARYIREFSGSGQGVSWKTGRGGHWETR